MPISFSIPCQLFFSLYLYISLSVVLDQEYTVPNQSRPITDALEKIERADDEDNFDDDEEDVGSADSEEPSMFYYRHQ